MFAFDYLRFHTPVVPPRQLRPVDDRATPLDRGARAGDRPRMRWDELFADLEGQFSALASGELDAEVADRTRREAALVRLVDRLRGSLDRTVRLGLPGGGTVTGRLASVGCDWALVDADTGGEVVVPLAGVMTIAGLGPASASPQAESAVDARLDLRIALRSIARDRAAVRVVLVDGTELSGTIDRVGADHIELAEHPAGEPRRVSEVRAVRVVPLHALVAVRSH